MAHRTTTRLPPYRIGRGDSRPLRLAAGLSVLALVLAFAGIHMARSQEPVPTILLGGNRVGEFQAVRGDGFLAWQQNSRRDPGHYDVFARPIEGGPPFRVNPLGTNGANGDIDGDLLVYQEFEGSRSDLRFFDLVDREASSPPRGVNTRHWEYWPSISGRWLLFGRLTGSGTRQIVLFDLTSRSSRKLDVIGGEDTFLAPGQVNGDHAVWYRCTPQDRCDVIRYQIPDRTSQTIPNPGRYQRAPSVGPDGTVYFTRSNRGCGNQVRLVRYPPGGPARVLWRLPRGNDAGTTRVFESQAGDTTVYFDNFTCGQPAASDVWQIVEPAPPSVTPSPTTTPPTTTTTPPPTTTTPPPTTTTPPPTTTEPPPTTTTPPTTTEPPPTTTEPPPTTTEPPPTTGPP